LFGGPYRQAVCLDDTYLLSASLYIHLNPVKAGACSHPLDYRWSSVKLYCADSAHAFVEPDFILGLLGQDGDVSGQRQNYLELLEKGEEVSVEQVLEQEDAINRFRKRLAEIFPSLFRAVAGKNSAAERAGIDLTDISSLEAEIERFHAERLNHTLESKAAKKYVIEQLIARGYKRTEMSEKLGVSVKTIYNVLRS